MDDNNSNSDGDCVALSPITKFEKPLSTQRKRTKYSSLNKSAISFRSKKFSLNSKCPRVKHESRLHHAIKKNSIKKIPVSFLHDLSSKPFRLGLKQISNIRSSKAVAPQVKQVEAHKDEVETKGNILSLDSAIPLKNEVSLNEISHLLPVINLLEKYNFKYEVMPDTLIKNNGFFLQDKQMNMFYQYYPEYVCIDVLCEIAELEYDLCLFISVDSNGHCEIISIGLIKSYNSHGLTWLCEVFRKHNPNWRKIQFIMSGKDIDCTETVKKAFPEKLVFISFFQALKAFKRILSNLEKVSLQDTTKALQLLEQMICTCSESEYSEYFKQMKQLHPSIVTLFRKVWHPRSDSWALGLLFNSKTVLKSFNSFLLAIRQKIRPLINVQLSVESTINKLHFALMNLRMERFKKFMSVLQTMPTLFCFKTNACNKYSTYLTRYASELVIEQLNLLNSVKNLQRISPGMYNVCGSEIVITINSCSCNFHKLIMLPCSHIFAVRNLLSLPLFADSLCALRWTASSYQNTFLDLQSTFSSNNFEKSQRFKKYFELNQVLYPLLLKNSDSVALDRIQLLKNLLIAWKNGLKISVKSLSKPNYSCDNDSVDEFCPNYWKEVYGLSLKDILDSDNDFSSLSLCSENCDLL